MTSVEMKSAGKAGSMRRIERAGTGRARSDRLKGVPRSARLCLLFLAAALPAFVRPIGAGEQPPAEKQVSEMSVEELRAYQAFYFVSGGRDPLTMRLPTDNEMGQDSRPKTQVAPTLEKMEEVLVAALEAIEGALKRQDFAGAIKASEDVIYIIDNEWPPLKDDPPHLKRMDEQIRNYNRMAVRLKSQEDTTREFASLSLRVDGVSWSPIDSRAVINGRPVAAGELLLNERKQGDLRVESIEEQGVVFQFKGMRFRKPVEVFAPGAGK